MAWHLFMTARLIRSAAGFCCSVQPASYSYHHQLFLLFRTNEKLWGRPYSPPSSHHFKDPKAMQSALQTLVLLCVFFPRNMQPKSHYKRRTVKYGELQNQSSNQYLGNNLITYRSTVFLSHSIFGIVILQQWNPCPEYSEDRKCPFAAADYLIYYFHHSIPAKTHLNH